MDDDVFDDIISFDNEDMYTDIISCLKDLFVDKVHSINISNTHENVVNRNLDDACKFVKEILQSIDITLNSQENISNDDVLDKLKDNLQKCDSILDSLLSFLKHLISSKEFYFYKCLPLNVAQILFSFFAHCKNREKIYSEKFNEIAPIVTNMFKKCYELEVSYFNIIENSNFDLVDDEQLSLLLNVIETVVNINEIVIDLEIKTMVEGWKGYLKMCEKYAEWLKDKMIHFRATTMLCACVEKNLAEILSPDISNVKQNRYLKVNDFIIKILIKITDIYSGYLCDNMYPIISCLLLVYQNSPSYLTHTKLKPSLIENIRTNIAIGTELLLINLLKDQHFIMHYFDHMKLFVKNRTLQYGHFLLTVTIIKHLPNQNEEVRLEWINHTENNIVCVLFDILPLCEVELLKSINLECLSNTNLSIYDFTFLYTSRLVFSCKNIIEIEKKLMKTLLKPHLLSATFACDLCLTISRFGSLNYCVRQLEYLMTVYNTLNKLKSFKNSPQEIYLSHLLQKLFKMLPKTSKKDFLSKYPISSDWNLWEKIGAYNIPEESLINECSKINDFYLTTYNKFLSFDNNTKINFFDMTKSLKVITTIPFPQNTVNTNSLSLSIIDMWNRTISFIEFNVPNQDISILNTHWYCEFLLLLLDATANIGFELNNKNWINILQILLSRIDSLPSLIKLGILLTLQIFISYEIPENQDGHKLAKLIIHLFRKIVENNNPIIRSAAMDTIIHFSVTSVNIKVVTNLKIIFESLEFINCKDKDFSENMYLQNLHGEFKHKCNMSEIKLLHNDAANGLINEKGNNVKISSCLKTIQCNVNMLKTESLTVGQKSELYNIKNTIDRLISNNH